MAVHKKYKALGKDAVKSEADFKEKIKEDIKKTLVDDADYKFAQDARKTKAEPRTRSRSSMSSRRPSARRSSCGPG